MEAVKQPVDAFKSPQSRMKKDDRKKQLLEEAKRLFLTLGYQQTTTEKIAQAAGVTEPVLYRHFPSKKALFIEVLEEIRQATLTRFVTESAHIPRPLDKLKAVIQVYLGSTKEHAIEYRIMHRTLVDTDDEEISACLRAFYLDSEAMLAHVIREGQKEGVFRRDLDPRVGAWELIRTALGYTLTLPLGIPVYQEENYLPRAIECLLLSLGVEKQSPSSGQP